MKIRLLQDCNGESSVLWAAKQKDQSVDDGADLRLRRAAAAEIYRPHKIELLLVAEAPPASPDRYFYFLNVQEQDSLFRYVCKGVLGVMPTRNKAPVLERLKVAGVYLIDLKLDPINGQQLGPYVTNTIRRCQLLKPHQIILIKASVFDAAFEAMRVAELPVVNVRIPFPGSGQQKRFESTFADALRLIGWKMPDLGLI
jgi:hypothetical protein